MATRISRLPLLWRPGNRYSRLAPSEPAIQSHADALKQMDGIIAKCNVFLKKQKLPLPWHQHIHVRNRPYNYLNPEDLKRELTKVKTWFETQSPEIANALELFVVDMMKPMVAKCGNSVSGRPLPQSILENANNLGWWFSGSEKLLEFTTSLAILGFSGFLWLALSAGGFPPIAVLPLACLALSIVVGLAVAIGSANEINIKQYGPVRTALEGFLRRSAKSAEGVADAKSGEPLSGMQRLDDIRAQIAQVSAYKSNTQATSSEQASQQVERADNSVVAAPGYVS